MDKKQHARQVNLVDFCIAQGIPLIDQNTKNPKLEEHDSLVFFPDNIDGQWKRFSTGEGGDAIAFVEWYYDTDFKKAIDILIDSKVQEIDPSKRHNVKKKPFQYKKEYESSKLDKAKEYLIKERNIDKNIVQLFIQTGLIKQDQRNNIIFKWIDDGKIVGANRQGTLTPKDGERSWKLIDKNSTTNRGFNLKIGKPKTLRFFESSIDLISYMSLNKDKLKDTWFISMEGLKKGLFEHYASKAVNELKKDELVPTAIYCVDNDEKGNEFAEEIQKLKSPYILTEQPINHKDWNDELKDLPLIQEKFHEKKQSNKVIINSWQNKKTIPAQSKEDMQHDSLEER